MSDNSKKEEEKEYDSFENIRLPKDQKFEDFDFFELTADISNSLTDQVYRRYHPIIGKEYSDRKKKFNDDNIRNDLDVDKIVKNIQSKVEADLADRVSGLLVDQIATELKEQYHSKPGSMEHRFDSMIKNIRWLMILPFLSVAIVVVAYGLVMVTETYYMSMNSLSFANDVFFNTAEVNVKQSLNKVVASILSILDLLLIGSLTIMVLVGGYENTISRIGMTHSVPTWFGKLDIAKLKIKVAASIIIISSIHLLMSFMQLDLESSEIPNYESLMWITIIHGVFVVSGIGLAFMDKLHKHGQGNSI